MQTNFSDAGHHMGLRPGSANCSDYLTRLDDRPDRPHLHPAFAGAGAPPRLGIKIPFQQNAAWVRPVPSLQEPPSGAEDKKVIPEGIAEPAPVKV